MLSVIRVMLFSHKFKRFFHLNVDVLTMKKYFVISESLELPNKSVQKYDVDRSL